MNPSSISHPHAIMMVGLPGSGKTFFAQQFSEMFNAPFVDSQFISEHSLDSNASEEVCQRFLAEIARTQINEEWLLESNNFDILNNQSQRNTKRGLDMIIAIILMVLASPVVLITAIIIKFKSKGPVIFKQIRIGENGKKFKIYKFRSMKIHDRDRKSVV